MLVNTVSYKSALMVLITTLTLFPALVSADHDGT
jgi:hypothetical protein